MQECVDSTGVRDTSAACSMVSRETCADIDQHAEPVELRDRGTAERAEAAVLGRRIAEIGARIAGIGKRIVAVVRQGQVARAECPEPRQARQIVADGEAVLHHRDDRQHAVALCCLDLIGRDGDPRGDAILAAAHRADRLQHGDGALECGGLAFRSAGGLRHVGDETARRQPAALHLRQIHPASAVQERIGAGRPGNVDMRVEGQQAAVQRDWVNGNGVIHGADARRNRRGTEGAGRDKVWTCRRQNEFWFRAIGSSTLDEPMPLGPHEDMGRPP